MKFREVARADDLVKRLKTVDRNIQSKVDIEELVGECSKMLVARRFRGFDHKIISDSVNDLSDWAGEIASHRARLADIRVMVINYKLRLEEMIKAVKNHLAATYPEHFKGRVSDKKEIIDSVLAKPIKTAARLDRLVVVTDEVYRELKDSHFSNVLVKQLIDSQTQIERI